jgi:hypothetical protein
LQIGGELRARRKKVDLMAVKWSFERLKSFSGISYDDLFSKCEQALLVIGLEICRTDKALGVIEAKKKATFPFKSGQQIFVTVRRDSKVSVIEKVNVGSSILGINISPDDMISEKFLVTLREMTRE